MRCDKVILAGLEATLRLYLQPEKLTETLPTLHLLTQSMDVLKEKAEQLKARLANRLKDYQVEIEESFAQIGSGSQPMATIPSIAVTIAEKTEAKLTALLAMFKALEHAIIGRIEKGKIWLDLRSVADFKALLDTVEKL